MPICQICGEEYIKDKMIGENYISCALIVHDNLDFEC